MQIVVCMNFMDVCLLSLIYKWAVLVHKTLAFAYPGSDHYFIFPSLLPLAGDLRPTQRYFCPAQLIW